MLVRRELLPGRRKTAATIKSTSNAAAAKILVIDLMMNLVTYHGTLQPKPGGSVSYEIARP
jgi:hypothetical protein